MKFPTLFKRKRGLSRHIGDLELHKHFSLERELGRGSFATVYLVRRRHDSLLYAFKHVDIQALLPEDRGDLVNELRLLSSLRHPVIIGCYEAFVELDQMAIITDYMPEGELAGLLRKHAETGNWLPERQIWSFFIQLLLGLRFLHHNHVRSHIALLPQGVLPGGSIDDERLCAEIAQPIKIPSQLWEWQCINTCLPPSSYPGGGSSVIEALCARPVESVCQVYLEGAGAGAPQRLQRPSGAAAATGVGHGGVCEGDLRRKRALSYPDLRVMERRNSASLAEALLQGTRGGRRSGSAHRAVEGQAEATEGGGGAAGGAGAGGAGELLSLPERSASDAAMLLLARRRHPIPAKEGGGGSAIRADQGALGMRTWLKPFDSTPVEFCPKRR